MELSRRARLPYVDLSTIDFDPRAGRFLKPELAYRYACVPYAASDSTLWVSATYPLDSETRHILEFAAGRKLSLAIAPEADIRTLQTRLYDSERLWATYLAGLHNQSQLFASDHLDAAPSTRTRALSGGAARALQLLLAYALARDSRWVQVQVTRSFTVAEHACASGSTLALVWPAWVGSLLLAWCETAMVAEGVHALWYVARETKLRLRCLLERHGPVKALTIELVEGDLADGFPPRHRREAKTFACPRCGEILKTPRPTVCLRCRMPVWRICRNCGRRFSFSQRACSCCGAAATPVPAAAPAAPLAPTGHPLRTRPVGAPPTELHVLVVDDQPDVRHCIARALEGLSVRISSVGSGQEALVVADNDPPHLVVLDMLMPSMDGFEVLQRLRSSLRTVFTPVLAVTVLDPLDHDVRQSLRFDDYCLQKPFTRPELVRSVARMSRLAYGMNVDAAIRNERSEACTLT